ncbi:MaoC family dehydratase [Brucella rhizosphaerae]|uniref:MaoC like domain protein n=1 Tax=Brucella rhizosphaerae TaxID=571254 RepID=A0A256FPU4_9HYPH|nr:MaoC family dehydratase [Brucella rhizosphaerae]OYR16778.1 maoC like domain protein [Brucella rhizosphaerae]
MEKEPNSAAFALPASAESQILYSDWLYIDQQLVDRFADVIDDHQFIHTDPSRAADESIFGGTIAHGFLVLGLLTKLSREALPEIAKGVVEINYGFDKVRFLAPVKIGSSIRGVFATRLVQPKGNGTLHTLSVTIEIKDETKPALVADWLILAIG